MDHKPTAVERAFQLAKSGRVKNLPELRSALRREGLEPLQIEGRTLTRELAEFMKAGRQGPEKD